MSKALLALSTAILVSGVTAAFATTSSSFRHAGPGYQQGVAQSIAASRHERIVDDPLGARQESPDEFCRGNNDIRTDVYCAPYKD